MKIYRVLVLAFFVLTSIALISCEATKGILNKGAEKALGPKNFQKVQKAAGGLEDLYNSFQETSIEDERSLGESVSLQAYATPSFGTPIRNDEMMLYVNCMANAIAQNSDRPMIPYHVAVIKSDIVNAFAAPGGYIFLTTGLILALDSEAELAAILGHEIAHISRKHALISMKRAQRLGGFAKVTSAAFENNFIDFEKLVKAMCEELINKSYDKDMEIDADTRGIQYAMNTGYDPRPFVSFLKKIQELQNRNAQGGLSSHPDTSTRIQEAENSLKKMEKELDDSFDTLAKNTDRFQTLQEWAKSSHSDWAR